MADNKDRRKKREDTDGAAKLEAAFLAVENARKGKRVQVKTLEGEPTTKATAKDKDGPPWTYLTRSISYKNAKLYLNEKASELRQNTPEGSKLRTKIKRRRRDDHGVVEEHFSCHYRWEPDNTKLKKLRGTA